MLYHPIILEDMLQQSDFWVEKLVFLPSVNLQIRRDTSDILISRSPILNSRFLLPNSSPPPASDFSLFDSSLLHTYNCTGKIKSTFENSTRKNFKFNVEKQHIQVSKCYKNSQQKLYILKRYSHFQCFKYKTSR